jgi:hypothetical protein
MGRKFLTRKGIGKQSALRQSLVSWLSISRKKASLFLQMTRSRDRYIQISRMTSIPLLSVLTSMPHGRNMLTKIILRFIFQRRKPKINVVCVSSFSGVSIHNAQIIDSRVGGG